jgi:dihydropteroate synthase
MQTNPEYENVTDEVLLFLLQRARAVEQHGIDARQIILDPGFGFGKSFQHNLSLFQNLPQIVASGYAILVGVSRKAMIGEITGEPAAQRMPGSIAAAILAAQAGASIVRVHDVKETYDALKVATALSAIRR